MKQYDVFKSKNIDELARWLSKYAYTDDSPWTKWFDEKYCKQCEPEFAYIAALDRECECGWCEVNGKCKFFQELDDIPNNEEIAKLWLESEVE